MADTENHIDVCVVGAGAAGLMCAIEIAKRGRSVLVLEGSNKIGKKILMSGGGRCNFTNLYASPDNFLSDNPHFCKSALSRYTPADFIEFVESHAINYHEKTLGQLFCDVSSKEIVAMLRQECGQFDVRIETDVTISSIQAGEHFQITSDKDSIFCRSLVIATGGLSIPKMGASDFGYRVARQFGHTLKSTRAGLVPFTFTGDAHERLLRLAGVSCPATVSVNGVSFSENILFTHRGLSGPAALQISNYWHPGDVLCINLLPTIDTPSLLQSAKQERGRSLLRTVIAEYLPRALVLELESQLWANETESELATFSDRRLDDIAHHLQHWELKPAATEGYRTAEVTLGGVNTDELSSKTLESKLQKHLYFVGEVVDVTGHLGGFNFQWAWASGWAAGQVA